MQRRQFAAEATPATATAAHRIIRRIVNDQSGVAEWRSGARKQRCSADNVITYFELINHLLVMSK